MVDRPLDPQRAKILEHISHKVFSGRWLLCMAAGLVFVWATTNKVLEPEAIERILIGVFSFYFASRQITTNKGEE